MRRFVRSILSAGVAVSLSLVGSAHFAAPTAAFGDRNQQMVDGFNGIRGMAGLGWMDSDACVQAVAQYRARDMAARGYFSHVSPEGTTVFDLLNAFGCDWSGGAAEVIEQNNSGVDQGLWVALTDFVGSPAHYGIIVGNYNIIGAAVVDGPNGMHYTAGVLVRR